MRLGIMQPYFFPYLGHFSLIAAVDEWVVFDITQYTPKTWMNRNRILHPDLGWQYVTVPLSNSSISIKTADAMIQNLATARTTALGKLSHYRKKAPYYLDVIELVETVFSGTPNDSLVQLNVSGLRAVCRYLDIPFAYRICSELNLALRDDLGPGDWAVEICRQLGATSYVNPAGGKALFDPAKFAAHDIALHFAHVDSFVYDPAPYRYEADLSILDVLMWNSPAEIKTALLKGCQLKPA